MARKILLVSMIAMVMVAYGNDEVVAASFSEDEWIKKELLEDARAGASPYWQGEESPVQVRGELRYSYASHRGEGNFTANDRRLRSRIYVSAPLHPDWTAYGMLEGQRKFTSDNQNMVAVGDRLYVSGISGKTQITAGKFSVYLAEGNLYDGVLTGLKMQMKDDVLYTAVYGTTNDDAQAYSLTADYAGYDYAIGGGVHHFAQRNGTDKTIVTASGNYQFEHFTLGATYLQSVTGQDRGNGYVYTLSIGDLKSWVSGSHQAFFKYYDQADATYVQHTMVGLGGRMDGFWGIGTGAYYTVVENVIVGVEYYHLRDKASKDSKKTLWSQITYYF